MSLGRLHFYANRFDTAAGLWLAGAMVSGPARYAAWVVAVATEVTAPVVATERSAGLPCILSTCPSGWGRRRASGSYSKHSSSEGSHQRPAG